MNPNQDKIEGNETLIGHLVELRNRLINSVFIIVFGFIIAWYFSDFIFQIIRHPIEPYLPQGGLVFTAPMDKFLAHVKVSLISGIILSSPLWLHQIWMFVSPGLHEKERRYGLGFILVGTFLFMVGVCFVYFVVYPAAFKFLMLFGGDADKPMITINEYISFFTTTTLVFGIAFEMPLILTILGMLGIISSEFLAEQRRYAIIVLAFISAVVTPPDALSMMFMLIPMIVLYEISVITVKMFSKKNQISEI